MNRRILYLLIFLSRGLCALGQDSYQFQNPTFQYHPRITGDTLFFQAMAEGLQSKGTGLPLKLNFKENYSDSFELHLALRLSFATSSNNYVKILFSDSIISGPDSFVGYSLMLGNTPDEISLYRDSSQQSKKLIDGEDKRISSSNTNLEIKVIRKDQTWELYSKILGENHWKKEGAYQENNSFHLKNLVLYFNYSPSNAARLFIHSLSITDPFIDSLAPKLLHYRLPGSDTLLLEFNEEIHSLMKVAIDSLPLKLETPLPNSRLAFSIRPPLVSNPIKQHTLTLEEFSDSLNNVLKHEEIHFKYALPEAPKPLDIHFSEVLFRPAAGQSEFLEIHNASSKLIDLEDLYLLYQSKQVPLPSRKVYPTETIILCANGKGLSFDSSKTLEVPGFPNLSSLGAELSLYFYDSQIPIHSLKYHYSDINDPKKQNSGFSLVLQSDPACFGNEVWDASTNYGGNPGNWKALYEASEPKRTQLLQAYPLDSNLLRLHFSEPLDPDWLAKADMSLDHKALTFDSLYTYSPFTETWHLRFKEPLNLERRSILKIKNLHSCKGEKQSEEIRLGAIGKGGQISFNELLFNPQWPIEDYVELYYSGDSTRDLKGFRLLSLEEGNLVKGEVELAPNGLLISPGGYYVFTFNPEALSKQFPKTNPRMLLSAKLPPMNADKGILVLVDSLGNKIDSVFYTEKRHVSSLQNSKGVSLEKIDESKSSTLSSNWTSASSSSGYGTPCHQNSQNTSLESKASSWTLNSPRLSPDNDAYEDLLLLQYKNTRKNCFVNIRVIDRYGQEVFRIAERELLGTEGLYQWDGVLDSGFTAPVGAYSLWIETYTDNSKKVARLSFAIVSKTR